METRSKLFRNHIMGYNLAKIMKEAYWLKNFRQISRVSLKSFKLVILAKIVRQVCSIISKFTLTTVQSSAPNTSELQTLILRQMWQNIPPRFQLIALPKIYIIIPTMTTSANLHRVLTSRWCRMDLLTSNLRRWKIKIYLKKEAIIS